MSVQRKQRVLEIANRVRIQRGLHSLVWPADDHGVLEAKTQNGHPGDYGHWIRSHDSLTDEDRRAIRTHIAGFDHDPKLGIVLRVRNQTATVLHLTLAAIERQLYAPQYVYVIVNKPRRGIRGTKGCPPIRWVHTETGGNEWHHLRDLLKRDHCDFVAFLEPGEYLAEHAAYHVALEIQRHPHTGIIYADEDRLDTRHRRCQPDFKPDWNPDLLLSRDYIGGACFFRCEFLERLDLKSLDPLERWGVALRVSSRLPAHHIRHIPEILFHKHLVTETRPGKPQKRFLRRKMSVVSEYLENLQIQARVELTGDNRIRIRFPLPQDPPLVTVVIPTRDNHQLLRRCIDTLYGRTDYSRLEVIVVNNRSVDTETLELFVSLAGAGRVRVMDYEEPFNYAAINNRAAAEARGEFLCLLNDDTEVISPDWLGEMVSHALRPGVGVVGALLYYPDGTIQHAGVILGIGGVGVAGHHQKGRRIEDFQQAERFQQVQDCSAVTGASLLISRSVFQRVGGLDEKHLPVAFNDVDLCLRVREAGYRIIWTPFAALCHHESSSRGPIEDLPSKRKRFRGEIEYMKKRWGHLLDADFAYNRNLALDECGFNLAFGPRRRSPWVPDAERAAETAG